MASLYPAQLIDDERRGRIAHGMKAEFVHLDGTSQILDVISF